MLGRYLGRYSVCLCEDNQANILYVACFFVCASYDGQTSIIIVGRLEILFCVVPFRRLITNNDQGMGTGSTLTSPVLHPASSGLCEGQESHQKARRLRLMP